MQDYIDFYLYQNVVCYNIEGKNKIQRKVLKVQNTCIKKGHDWQSRLLPAQELSILLNIHDHIWLCSTILHRYVALLAERPTQLLSSGCSLPIEGSSFLSVFSAVLLEHNTWWRRQFPLSENSAIMMFMLVFNWGLCALYEN